MAEVTVIAPNVVELVGSLTPPARNRRHSPTPRNAATPQSRDSAGEKSRSLAANNNNAFQAPPRAAFGDPPRPKPRPAARPEQPPSQPSTAFLTQLLAQRSGTLAAQRFDKAIAAYQRAGASQPSTGPTGIAFLVRTVDRLI